jgi:hypothetical protein
MDDIKRPKSRSESGETDTKPGPAKEVDNLEEPKFVPPEEIAAQEEANEEVEMPIKKIIKRKLKLRLPKTKKEWLIVGAVLAALLGLVAVWWFFIRENKSIPIVSDVVHKVTQPEKPKTEASKLSGLQVDPELNKRPVTGVMIGNSSEARPQSGLLESSLVFEAVAEGGITRFLALFQDTTPEHIGPIRSIRPYYLDWLLPFDGAISHVGGSPQALSDIKSLKIRDLDEFANGGSYTRITSRYSPHNVYTSLNKLLDLQKRKGFETSSFTGFERKKEKALPTPTAKTINLNISSVFYNAKYDYDPTTNTYKRSQGGSIHTDEKSGHQLAPKVVIAIVMERGIDGDGEHTAYQTTGSNKVYVFQDGGVTEGNWSKSSRTAQWVFTDANNKAIKLNPGQTWVTMVSTPGSVSFAP